MAMSHILRGNWRKIDLFLINYFILLYLICKPHKIKIGSEKVCLSILKIILPCVHIYTPSGKGSCVQLWYHMYGSGVGTLNVYQQATGESPALLFSQMGDQGQLWRFAQAGLFFHDRPYRVSPDYWCSQMCKCTEKKKKKLLILLLDPV